LKGQKGLRGMHWENRYHQWHKCEVCIRVQASLMQSESYFAFFKTFTSFSTECLVSKQ